MTTMNAAVVTSFAEPPHYLPFDAPRPQGPHEAVVEVLAAGLHPRVRSGAAGTHYTSTGGLPMVPGVDGVGRLPDGAVVYFAAHHGSGTMAEKAVVDVRGAVPLPDGVDPALIAASMNPALSSWMALRLRAPLRPGATVLVLGATGSAGAMAVRLARRLGAGRVVGVGRDEGRLAALAADGSGADTTVRLGALDDADGAQAFSRELGTAASDADLVLDYLWGRPTELALGALLDARVDAARPLDWVQIGSMAGTDIRLPSAALRSHNVRLLGNGQGSVSPEDYARELPSLAAELAAGGPAVTPVVRPLADVERVWGEREAAGERIVLVP